MKNSKLLEQRDHRLSKATAYYRYQPADDERLKALSKEQIWISDSSKFNDPSDLRLKVEDLTHRGPFWEEDRLRLALQYLMKDNQHVANYWFYDEDLIRAINQWLSMGSPAQKFALEQEIAHRFLKFGVACFSPKWDNQLMWAHYAQSHQGFCVEYAVGHMTLASENMFSSFHVQYTSQLPELCISEALFSPHQTLSRMLATKHLDWAYENEWRLVHLEKKGVHVNVPKGLEISALIAGVKTDADYWKKLREKADSLGIPAFRMKKMDYSYEFEMKLID
jgi:hypothetical protein